MTFNEANAIVKSTDDAKLDDEAKKAFGIEYQINKCLFCGRNVKCKMTSPTVKKCNFYFPYTEIEYK